jgi:predicted phosphodiesterase
MANRTAARHLATLYPDAFTVESARTAIRDLRGVRGNGIPGHARPDEDLAAQWKNIKGQLPAPIQYDFKPVAPQCDLALIISDAQVPFHDNRAIEAAVKKGKADKADLVLVNGDWWDCHEFSRFERDPSLRSLTDEAFAARQTFAYLRNEFPKARIVFKVGNHEERQVKHLARNMLGALTLLEKTGRMAKSFASVGGLLELDSYKIEMVEDRRPVRLGKYLYVLHGHEGGGSFAPVLPARAVALKTRVCAVVAHWHRTSTYAERAMDGKELVCYSTGCLCDLTPKWLPQNQWNHGFATAEVSKDGGFKLHNYRISGKGEVWL